jgi:hypothetical protein
LLGEKLLGEKLLGELYNHFGDNLAQSKKDEPQIEWIVDRGVTSRETERAKEMNGECLYARKTI